MAIKSYDKKYLDSVATNIGTTLEYAVNCGFDPEEFWDLFTSSFVAKQIEKGNPRFLVGYSAIDLLNLVVNNTELNKMKLIPKPFFNRSKFYWAGWVLSQYQNNKAISFFNLNKAFPIKKVLALYDTLHEADITKFYSIADEYISANKKQTNLKRIRIAAGLSQKSLAEKAQVSIRNIQTYEQRQNDINKAQADILVRLSKTLGCNIEDLFED